MSNEITQFKSVFLKCHQCNIIFNVIALLDNGNKVAYKLFTDCGLTSFV